MTIVILDYFTVKSSKLFSSPKGPLPNRITSAVIDSANREVLACGVINKELPESASSRQKGNKPWVCSPHERAELDKLAVATTEAVKLFSTNYPVN